LAPSAGKAEQHQPQAPRVSEGFAKIGKNLAIIGLLKKGGNPAGWRTGHNFPCISAAASDVRRSRSPAGARCHHAVALQLAQ
jgi:hypothetical protein